MKELQNLQRAMKERTFFQDKPEDSDIYQMRVREGDLLLLATDGVFDNLFEEEILAIVNNHSRNREKTIATARALSSQIAQDAYTRSKKVHVKTPFSIKKAQFIQE